MGPDWYLLLQQEQEHLPEDLDRWDLTDTYSCNRRGNTSLRSWAGGTRLVPTPSTGAAPPP